MSDVLLSVVIPAWNAAGCLPQAVASARAALPPGSEIVVAVDGSADDTPEVAQSLARDSGGTVRMVRHPDARNRGAGATRNLGIEAARGELIAFLDADDRYRSGRFGRCLPFLQEHPEIDAVFESTAVEYETNADRDSFRGVVAIGADLFHVPDLVAAVSRGKCWHLDAMTLRRSAIAKMGAFDAALPRGQDVEFMLRAVCRLAVRPVPDAEPVAVYRRHPRNRSAFGREGDMLRVIRHSLKWASTMANGCEDRISEAYLSSVFDRARQNAAAGRRAKAGADLLRAAWHFPRLWRNRLFWRTLGGIV
jgi:glycosyltransferase involved in cell wall biosynthesis